MRHSSTADGECNGERVTNSAAARNGLNMKTFKFKKKNIKKYFQDGNFKMEIYVEVVCGWSSETHAHNSRAKDVMILTRMEEPISTLDLTGTPHAMVVFRSATAAARPAMRPPTFPERPSICRHVTPPPSPRGTSPSAGQQRRGGGGGGGPVSHTPRHPS